MPELDDDITLDEFVSLVGSAYKQDAECKEMKKAWELEKSKLARQKTTILAYMETHKLPRFSSDYGLVVRRSEFSVKNPATPEDRQLFYGWLKEKGIFEDLVTVNSRTLNAFYKSEAEAAISDGVDEDDFKIPGLDSPSIYEKINLNKG